MLGGMKYRPVWPRHDEAPQIIWLGGCFIVATFFLSNRLPNGHLMCMWRGTNCCMVHSSENITFFHSARVHFQSLFLHHCCLVWLLCRPVRLQSKHFVEMSRNSAGTYYFIFKCKIARLFCMISLASALLSVSLRGFPWA